MRGEVRRGVLVVGHGSRRREANDDVREATRRIAERGRFSLVEAAFLEIESPDIGSAFTRLVERGANEIIVHPYFLSPGRHTRGDIPVAVQKAAVNHPGVNYRITEPLSAHPLVIDASVERLWETIERDAEETASNTADYRARRGMVYLVGAGPGDPGLLTIKARDLLASADVVIYDYLVNPELLCHLPLQAERIYVGKIGGGRQTSQDRINCLLIRHAQAGARVVRLKGGDPFLFGRGGEEAEALRGAGVRFEVVPGISSALAVPAYAGIPLTHRDFSSSVSVVTGARARNAPACLGSALCADTIVILMGVNQLREIVAELIAGGRSIETPAAVIRWGTYEGQVTVTGTLETIATEARISGMRPPAVIVVGEVVKLRERLRWFEQTPETMDDEEIQSVFATG